MVKVLYLIHDMQLKHYQHMFLFCFKESKKHKSSTGQLILRIYNYKLECSIKNLMTLMFEIRIKPKHYFKMFSNHF